MAPSSTVIALGYLLFKRWDRVRAHLARLDPVMARGPEAGYEAFMHWITVVSEWQTRILQNGYMRNYILVMVLVLLTKPAGMFGKEA